MGAKLSGKRASLLGGLLLLLVSGVGCTRFQAEAPQGFATYEQKSPFRAVSPDGVVFRVRSEKNKPHAELPFWKEALKKRMVDAGYRFVSEKDIKAGGKDGYLLELAAPLGNQDYTYVIALFQNEEHLVIVESAGEISRFSARRDAVLAALDKLRF